jgi:ubiquinone/menaquinone biosynthesis C-methylase UbiE
LCARFRQIEDGQSAVSQYPIVTARDPDAVGTAMNDGRQRGINIDSRNVCSEYGAKNAAHALCLALPFAAAKPQKRHVCEAGRGFHAQRGVETGDVLRPAGPFRAMRTGGDGWSARGGGKDATSGTPVAEVQWESFDAGGRPRLEESGLRCGANAGRLEGSAMGTYAVDVHSSQAGEFEARYRALAEDPYRSTFTYGRRKIEQLLERELVRFAPGARALDVGCGTGFNVATLLRRGFSVTGVEPSEAMRERAIRDNPQARIIDGDISALPFRNAIFDIVVCIEVIRYLEDPGRGLAEIARVLAPNGLAFITAAPALSLNGYALLNQITGRVRIPTFTKIKHSFMTVRSAERAMNQVGFRRVEVHGTFLGPWHALGRLSPDALALVLRTLEPIDDRVSDLTLVRDFTNHLVLIGSK